MPAPRTVPRSSHVHFRLVWLTAAAVLLLGGIWFLPDTNARGSNVLIVIEDAAPVPTGVFPGNVCYRLARNSDRVVVTEGCLAIAAAIATPAGFDYGVQYTLMVTLHDTSCRELPDSRVGNGAVPFRIRIACDPGGDGTAESAGVTPGDAEFAAASASPVARPIAAP